MFNEWPVGCWMHDSMVALSVCAERFGVAVIPTTVDIAAMTTDGSVTFAFIPLSFTPEEQGRALAEVVEQVIYRRNIA